MSLYIKPSKISSLARELDITAQEAFRNINRLTEANLIKRGDDDVGSTGVYYLTGRYKWKMILMLFEIPSG